MGLPGALVLGLSDRRFDGYPRSWANDCRHSGRIGSPLSRVGLSAPIQFLVCRVVFGIYFVLIQIKSIWLRPRIMGYFLSMNEGLIFVAIIGAVVLWGILGALIIVPLLATMGAIGHYVRCRLLNLDPWPEDVTYATSPPADLPSDEELAQTLPGADKVAPIPNSSKALSAQRRELALYPKANPIVSFLPSKQR